MSELRGKIVEVRRSLDVDATAKIGEALRKSGGLFNLGKCPQQLAEE